MNKKNILILLVSCSIIGTSTYFLGKKISEKKINKQIKTMGNLNIMADSPNPELYLELDKTAMEKLSNTKYSLFNVRLLTNQQTKKMDA